MDTQLQRVNFAGAYLEALENDGRVWAVVKRVCENLGIDTPTQQTKLSSLPWATTGIIPAVALDGKQREVFAIELDSLPMWLATIHASKVRAEVRERLVIYQREARQVLADHFFGRTKQAPQEDVERAYLRGKVEALEMAMRLLGRESVGEVSRHGNAKPPAAAKPWEARVLARACDFLRGVLAAGPKPATEVEALAKEARVKLRTLTRAKAKVGIESYMQGRDGAEPARWFWRLPAPSKN